MCLYEVTKKKIIYSSSAEFVLNKYEFFSAVLLNKISNRTIVRRNGSIIHILLPGSEKIYSAVFFLFLFLEGTYIFFAFSASDINSVSAKSFGCTELFARLITSFQL